MKKVLLFFTVILSVFTLLAQETAKEEVENNGTEAVNSEAQAEEVQPAETPSETSAKEESEKESQPEVAAELEKQAEASHQAVIDAMPESSDEVSETKEELRQSKSKAKKKAKPQKIRYSRPYIGLGIPMVVIGSLSVIGLMPAMGAMAFAASDTCKNKDSRFCEELRNDDHTAWTTGAVLTGVLGAGMIITGSWLVSVKKPLENQYIEVTELALAPTEKGFFASFGFNF